MIFELLKDFTHALEAMPQEHPRHHLLKLLDEAIRRDVHFIDRHPTTFFQCMWNTCWWYDCPEAAEHYANIRNPSSLPMRLFRLSTSVFRIGRLEAKSSDDPPELFVKLHTRLEDWHEKKERVTPNHLWLRSIRPPIMKLGTGQQAVFSCESGATNAIWSHDGRRITSLGADVRVWDVNSNQVLVVLEGQVAHMSYSLDGKSLAIACSDNTVRIWDTVAWKETKSIREVNGLANDICWSPDGSRIACAVEGMGQKSGLIYVWNGKTGAEQALLTGHSNDVVCLSWSPDGTTLASGSRDKTVRIWNMSKFADAIGHPIVHEIIRSFEGHSDVVTSVCWSPDGTKIISGSKDGSIRMWDVKTGHVLAELRSQRRRLNWLIGPRAALSSTAWSFDGTKIAAGSTDGSVRIWDAENRNIAVVLKGHDQRINSVAFSPNGDRIASASSDGTVRVWYSSGGLPAVNRLGDGVKFESIHFSPEGDRILTREKRCIYIWDSETGTMLRSIRRHWLTRTLTCARWSPDGTHIVCGSTNGTACITDVDSGRSLVSFGERGPIFPLIGMSGRSVIDARWSANGKSITTCTRNGTICIWDPATGKLLTVLRKQVKVASADVSPDGTRLICGYRDGKIRNWNLVTCTVVAAAHTKGYGGIRNVAFSKDGGQIISQSFVGEVRIWEADTLECLKMIPSEKNIDGADYDIPRAAWLPPAYEGDSAVLYGKAKTPIAFYPDRLFSIIKHWPRRIYATVEPVQLHLLRLEGDLRDLQLGKVGDGPPLQRSKHLTVTIEHERVKTPAARPSSPFQHEFFGKGRSTERLPILIGVIAILLILMSGMMAAYYLGSR